MLLLAEEVLEGRLEDENKDEDEDGTATSLLLLGKIDERDAERDELAPGDVELDGAGTTALASTSLPIPQGMLSPEGWFWLAGGVEEPSDPVMLNRVVQVLLMVCMEVN